MSRLESKDFAKNFPDQNASAANSMVVALPVWMRARCKDVSGSILSMKKRPVTSLLVR